MKCILFLLIIFTALFGNAQKSEKYNLGFEEKEASRTLPKGWIKWGDYALTADSLARSGSVSGKITSDKSGSSFGSMAYVIPANYAGKSITLQGFMKLKDVQGGFAGLLLRIDGQDGTLEFDNMKSQGIKGTKDWEKYSITLNYPEDATDIFVAGILVGKGEAWFDDFKLTIDGKNVQHLKEVEKELSPAMKDTTFNNGSTIVFPELSTQKIDDLELLGRVWGFLKYYHPEIAKGNYNWDYELFRFLPDYLAANEKATRNNLLIEWIDNLGHIEKCTTCQPADENAFLKPDLNWIKKTDNPLREKLNLVYASRSQGEHYYIQLEPMVNNPKFTHENAYTNRPYPDGGFRLLALYRYWNMINYFFPYKHLMDKDWNEALAEYIPIFVHAKNELEYELAAVQLIADIKDTHANLWGGADQIEASKGMNYPPFHVRFIENKLVVTDYYNPELKEKAGLEIGDVITKINGQTIEQIIKAKTDYYPASNVPTRLRNISADILRSNVLEVEISYIDKTAREQTKMLKLYPKMDIKLYHWYPPRHDLSYKMLENNIGYITLQNIREQDIPEIKKTFKKTKGIIIDIRNYPSTFVPFSLGTYFVKSSTPFVKFTEGDPDNPGAFTFTEPLEIPNGQKTYKGKLVVLVNELSQSQAEYTAMAFRAGDNTTIIGSTTAGADGNVSRISLPGGLSTMISGIGVYYPEGGETQRVGIVPDIEVLPTIEGIRAGRDELMEKAIEIILNQK